MFKQMIAAAAAAAMLGAFGTTMAQTKGETKLEHAAHKTADATRKAAHKTADATRSAAHKTAKVTRKAAHKTAQVTRNAAHKTANATRRAVNRVKHDDRDFRADTTREQRINDAHSNWQRTRRL